MMERMTRERKSIQAEKKRLVQEEELKKKDAWRTEDEGIKRGRQRARRRRSTKGKDGPRVQGKGSEGGGKGGGGGGGGRGEGGGGGEISLSQERGRRLVPRERPLSTRLLGEAQKWDSFASGSAIKSFPDAAGQAGG